MAVKLRRSTDTVGSFIKFKIRVNDKEVAQIAANEEQVITLPEENAKMQVKQFSGKSNALIVNDGETVEITNGPFVFWGFVLSLLLVPLATTLLGVDRLIGLALVVIVYLIALQFVDSFKLTKLDDTHLSTE
ncbi:hypothetical protein [Alkalibacterium gilvum]|uniref:hypothetical protein n=1 Tax=Alkalibacterium gilvum TaxID=1130080 RepID=UPI003F91E74B